MLCYFFVALRPPYRTVANGRSNAVDIISDLFLELKRACWRTNTIKHPPHPAVATVYHNTVGSLGPSLRRDSSSKTLQGASWRRRRNRERRKCKSLASVSINPSLRSRQFSNTQHTHHHQPASQPAAQGDRCLPYVLYAASFCGASLPPSPLPESCRRRLGSVFVGGSSSSGGGSS